tara:strand:- start:34 stop:744 length:711 start_codon:yes stop_codon:yes gene_type:complete
MATTATLTLSSDLVSDALKFSTTSTLTKAGGSTAIASTAGLSKTNFTADPIQSKVIYRSDDATANGANKVYLKNASTDATEYFTVFIDQEEMGRLYGGTNGDWALFPWSATSGTKETFRVCITAPWVVGDEFHFDGVETKAANTVVNDIAAQVHAQNYPNWTTTVSTNYVTFTARDSKDDGTVVIVTADMEIIQSSAGAATAVVDNAALGTATESDIIVVPSVVTTMDLEHMLFYE